MRARSSMVERFSYKEKGVGSSPTVPTKRALGAVVARPALSTGD